MESEKINKISFSKYGFYISYDDSWLRYGNRMRNRHTKIPISIISINGSTMQDMSLHNALETHDNAINITPIRQHYKLLG